MSSNSDGDQFDEQEIDEARIVPNAPFDILESEEAVAVGATTSDSMVSTP